MTGVHMQRVSRSAMVGAETLAANAFPFNWTGALPCLLSSSLQPSS